MPLVPPPLTTSEGYLKAGAAELARLEADKPNDRKARNVIIFIGDGMSVTTLTAARIFEGQQKGVDGESYVAQMDRLPHTALVKTYSHDGQVPDSAPTATAIVSGVKTLNGVIGVGHGVGSHCRGSRYTIVVSSKSCPAVHDATPTSMFHCSLLLHPRLLGQTT